MVLTENGVETPLIDHAKKVIEFGTKTRARQESDDDSFLPIVELHTKTQAAKEQDD